MDRLAASLQNTLHIDRLKPNLSDLPVEIVEQIVKEANLPSRLSLRKVSRTLRTLVDRQDPICDCIGIYVTSDFLELYLEDRRIVYRRNDEKTMEDVINNMFTDLLTFISHPKFLVKTLKIEFAEDISSETFALRAAHYLPFEIGIQCAQIQFFDEQPFHWTLYCKSGIFDSVTWIVIEIGENEIIKHIRTKYYKDTRRIRKGFKTYPRDTPIETLALIKRPKNVSDEERRLLDGNSLENIEKSIELHRETAITERKPAETENTEQRKPWNANFSKYNSLSRKG